MGTVSFCLITGSLRHAAFKHSVQCEVMIWDLRRPSDAPVLRSGSSVYGRPGEVFGAEVEQIGGVSGSIHASHAESHL